MKNTLRKNYVSYIKILRVVDPDTLRVDNDLGHKLGFRDMLLRLNGLDCPELHSPRAVEVAAAVKIMGWISKTFPPGSELIFESDAAIDKYGRLIGKVSDGVNTLNEMLLVAGFAHPYDGGKKQPWTDEELQRIVDLKI